MGESTYRWSLLAILLVNLAISAFFRRRARRLTGTIKRSQEGAGLKALRLLIVLPSLVVLVGYLAAPNWSGWLRVPLPDWLRLLGVPLGMLCAANNIWVFRTLGGNVSETVLLKDTHQLVREGPYRWVRHPLYANGLLLVVSFILLSANAYLLGLGFALTVFLQAAVIPREEANLAGRFGQAYRDYQQQTGRLLPKLRREK